MKRVLLTHYDLDGVGCNILAGALAPFDKVFYYGYAKITDAIKSGKLSGYDRCLITDVSLTKELFDIVYGEYGDNFTWFDHHTHSEEMLKDYKFEPNAPKPSIVVDMKMSATALFFTKFLKSHHKDMAMFEEMVSYIDSYDMWRHETHPEHFNKGYDLNTLFWDMGLYDFRDRFKYGTVKLNTREQKIADVHRLTVEDSITSCEKMEIDSKNAIFIGTEPKYVNDFSLHFKEYNVLYMVYTTQNDMLRISIRNRLDNIPLDGIVKSAQAKFPEQVITAGGHDKASGVDLHNECGMNDIIDVIEFIHEGIYENVA